MSIVSYSTPIVKQGLAKTSEGRFSGEVGKIVRNLNKLAIKENREDIVRYTFPKASSEDSKRLKTMSMKDTYKRVTWTNPKDNKVYHILEEGRKDGKIQVKILNQEGDFIKNADLEPKNIVIFDVFYNPRAIAHGQIVETLLKRFNPFANVERLPHKQGLYEMIRYHGGLPMHLEIKRFKQLEEQMEKGKKVDYISVSDIHPLNISSVSDKTGAEKQKYARKQPFVLTIAGILENIISKGTRILEAAGNDTNPKNILSDRLSIDGIEGVGSLSQGKVANDSCSRNSIFTQHYERRDFFGRLVRNKAGKPQGVNISGLRGIDLPLNWKTKKLVGRPLSGTSYATPVRVAKLSLNDMMEGIL